MSKDLGKSTSYAYYVAEGGTKTPQEYGEMLVNIDTVATRAEDAADSAAESATGALNSKNAAHTAATTATNKASEATTAAQTATTKAGEAQTSAQTASSKASEASQSASTASTKASEATTAAATATSAATTATTAKDDAVSAKTAAQTAQTGAETAAASVQSSAAQIATNAEDISQLKSELTVTNGGTYSGSFERGSFNTSTGAPASANYRLRTVDYIPIDVFISATCGTGYGLIVFAWNGNTYLGASNASFADATSVTVSTVKSKYPTATQVKVAFSNLSGTTLDPSIWTSYGLAVNVYIKSADLSDKIDQTYYVTGLMETSNNLFNALSAKNNTSLSTSNGAESYNTDRWATGFIAYDSIKHPLMIYSRMFPASVIFYNENKGYIDHVSRNEYPYAVPSETAYVRAVFLKTTVAFENRWVFYLGYADGSQVAFANEIVDRHYYDTKSRGYIDIADVMQYADESGAFKSSFTMVIPRCEDAWKNLILSTRTMYSGDNAPTLKFRYIYGSLSESDNASVFTSREYVLGGKDCYIAQEFRNPPYPKYQQLLFVVVTIPTGTTLYIDDIHTEYSNSVNRRSCGTRFNAHQGFIQLCPQDSISGYAMAAKLGFDCCITIPKETSDGVLVCFHDDNSVGTKLVDANGDVLSAELQTQSINQFTYAELSQLYINPESTIKAIYPKEKIPTLEEFFAVCAKTGMHPMLSVHPNLSQSGWESVKALAEKYGLLESLNIKIGYALAEGALSLPYSVFGSDIESYTIDVNTQTDGTAYVSYLDAELSGATCRVCVEYFYSVITATNIANTLTGGYAVACAEMGRATTAEIKRLMSLGVTEFTSDYFASVGLNW